MKKGTSVTLSIYNQEAIIERVVRGIIDNVSSDVKEFIILLDGCIDNTEKVIEKTLSSYHTFPFCIKIGHAPNVNEVMANNICFKQCEYEYIVTVQDDIVVTEPNFDLRLKTPFMRFGDVFAVSARLSHNDYFTKNNGADELFWGEDTEQTDRETFYIRDLCIRGPLMLNHKYLKKLNYLDENYAPISLDDHDLCLRAYQEYRLVSGCYPSSYISKLEWGATRTKPESAGNWYGYFLKNQEFFINRHREYLRIPKHTENRRLF